MQDACPKILFNQQDKETNTMGKLAHLRMLVHGISREIKELNFILSCTRQAMKNQEKKNIAVTEKTAMLLRFDTLIKRKHINIEQVRSLRQAIGEEKLKLRTYSLC